MQSYRPILQFTSYDGNRLQIGIYFVVDFNLSLSLSRCIVLLQYSVIVSRITRTEVN